MFTESSIAYALRKREILALDKQTYNETGDDFLQSLGKNGACSS